VCGGKITGLAAYDVMYTMEIAEDALAGTETLDCIDAMEKINTYIVHGIKS